MKYQEWLNGCGCCPDIQDCPPSTGNPCDCDSILLELSKQHTDDLVLQDEIDNLDEKKLDASAYTPDEYATEAWVNEQGFLKTVEPLKTINGESLIGEGDIVISGGSGDAYTKAETDALLDEKQNVLNAGDYITIDSANTISTSGLVTVEDNEVPDYNVTSQITYQGGYPSQSETASTWADASMFTLRYNFFEKSDVNYTTTAAVIDPSGNITTGSVATDEYGIRNPLPDYIDMVKEDVEYVGANYYFTAKEGYRIAHLDVFSQGTWSSSYANIIEERVETVFEGGQSADVIKDVIEPELLKKQDTLTSGENIKTINNISILGSGNIDVQSLTNVPVYSGSALASVSINNPSSLDNGCNRISGNTSVGAGYMVETRNADEAAFGVYNLSNGENLEVFNYDSGSTLFSVGNGHPHTTGGYIRKHNAFEIRQNGDIYYADTNDTEAEYPYEMPMIKLQDVIKNLQNEINSLKAQINGN